MRQSAVLNIFILLYILLLTPLVEYFGSAEARGAGGGGGGSKGGGGGLRGGGRGIRGGGSRSRVYGGFRRSYGSFTGRRTSASNGFGTGNGMSNAHKMIISEK